MKIKADAPMQIDGVRFYKDDEESGTHTASVWASDGTLLRQASFTTETASGWQQVPLPSPVPLHPNVTYVVGVNANSTFVQTLGGLSAGAGAGRLSALIGENAVYGDTAGVFPAQSYASSNYFVDVVTSDDGAFPAVVSTDPVSGSTTAPTSGAVRATFDNSLNAATVNDDDVHAQGFRWGARPGDGRLRRRHQDGDPHAEQLVDRRHDVHSSPRRLDHRYEHQRDAGALRVDV